MALAIIACWGLGSGKEVATILPICSKYYCTVPSKLQGILIVRVADSWPVILEEYRVCKQLKIHSFVIPDLVFIKGAGSEDRNVIRSKLGV